MAVDGIVGPVTSERLARFAAASARHAWWSIAATSREVARRSPGHPEAISARSRTVSPAPTHTATNPGRTNSRPPRHSGFESRLVGRSRVRGRAAVRRRLGARPGAAPREDESRIPQASEPEPSFQVRFHGRDGKSVMTAAEILSVAALVDGHDALAFPSFRAGPMGPRVVAFCRIGGRPLRPRESIGRPERPDRPGSGSPPIERPVRWAQARGLSARQLDEQPRGTGPRRVRRHAAARPAAQHSGERDRDASTSASRCRTPLWWAGSPRSAGACRWTSVANSIRERFPGQTGDGDVAAAEAGFRYVQAEVREIARVDRHARPAAAVRVHGERGAA